MTGEVADFQQADQFQAGKSQFECGYFGVMMARSMAQIGQPPTLSVQQIIDSAEKWYAQYDGSDALNNTDGMTTAQEYALLSQVGLHYQAIQASMSALLPWLAVGYPVLVAVAETSVFDLELGRNPYPWNPAGNHIFLLTGKTSSGDVLVRDSANCSNLYDPNSLRPGPRTYDASRLALVSATVIVPPWLPRPTSAIAPTVQQMESSRMLQIAQVSAYFDAQSDGTWKCKKNNCLLAHGMLNFYQNTGPNPLFGLALFGLPLSNEIGPVLGKNGTTLQLFERAVLCYDPSHQIDNPPAAGSVYPMHIDSGPGATALLGKSNPLTDLVPQVAQLKTQVDSFFDYITKQLQG